jgi:DNA-binding XRE family transcriptional regulator
MPKQKKRTIPEPGIYYKSRFSGLLAHFNERLPKDQQIAMQHVATAIDATRQSMYLWNKANHLFQRPDMQIAAGLARYFNAKAEELRFENWQRLQPYDMLITIRIDEQGNEFEGIQLAVPAIYA